jgi:hypothetical protein
MDHSMKVLKEAKNMKDKFDNHHNKAQAVGEIGQEMLQNVGQGLMNFF